MIFIERDTALSKEEIYKKIQILRDACDTGDDLIAKEALREVVPTFKKPEDVKRCLDGENVQMSLPAESYGLFLVKVVY